jgi:hypothetical protein
MKPSIAVVLGVVLALLFLLLLLGGCSAMPKIGSVLTPISRPCITDTVPPPPEHYADDKVKTEKDPAVRAQMRFTANLERKARLTILEPAVASCRK